MNQIEERLISPAAQAGPCVLLVSETKTSAEGMREDAGSKKRKGRERNVTNTSDVVGRKEAPRGERR